MRELRHRLTRSIDATGLRRTKMAMITERSTKEPLLKVRRIGHGTLGVVDLAKSRRFYEEVLGFDVIQTSPISMMIRKGTDQVYAVVEVGERKPDMARINHNGLDVDTDEEVRSEEHTSELQSLMRISYAAFCLKKKRKNKQETQLTMITLSHNRD